MKIAFVSDPDKYAHSQMQTLEYFCSLFSEFKIVSPEKSELLFVHHRQVDEMQGRPLIVIERADSSTLGFARPYLKYDNVLGIFKHTLLRPRHLQNEPFCFRRYHITVLDDIYRFGAERSPLEPILDTEWQKIHCAVPILFRWREFPNINAEKNNNVLCRSTLQNIPHIEKHRGDAILHSNGKPRLLPPHKWQEMLSRTKICVCPWGFGEMCYRDYEAMLSGCVVVKPNTDFVETWPEIYKSGHTYFHCKTDFSDLNEVCQRILDNYEDCQEMLEANKKMLREPNIPEMKARFISILHSLGIVI